MFIVPGRNLADRRAILERHRGVTRSPCRIVHWGGALPERIRAHKGRVARRRLDFDLLTYSSGTSFRRTASFTSPAVRSTPSLRKMLER